MAVYIVNLSRIVSFGDADYSTGMTSFWPAVVVALSVDLFWLQVDYATYRVHLTNCQDARTEEEWREAVSNLRRAIEGAESSRGRSGSVAGSTLALKLAIERLEAVYRAAGRPVPEFRSEPDGSENGSSAGQEEDQASSARPPGGARGDQESGT